jgi:hypothetical protein
MTQHTPSPWGGLRSRFIGAREAADQQHIFDLSTRIAQSLQRWAARYPLIRQVRIRPLALSVAAAAPTSSVEALISTARLSLWVFTLDDLFDEGGVSAPELLHCAAQYCAIARDEPTMPSQDSLATALGDVRADLSTYPLFDALGHEWANALCATIDGMQREYVWGLDYQGGHGATLPTYAEYREVGRYSIGGPPHVWAALITTDDLSIPQHLDHLHEMERVASTCIRLANDLRSHAKEVAEGKINSLVLLESSLREDGLPPNQAAERAEELVREEIVQGLAQLTQLQYLGGTQTGRAEAAIADIARFTCDFYTTHDYHTFTTNPPS